MLRYRISTGTSRLSPTVRRKTVSSKNLIARLLRYDVIDIDYAAYMKLDREEQSNLKDVGWFIGGQFKTQKRLAADMKERTLITLDIDHLDAWDLDEIALTYGKYEYVVHSTLKHCSDTPRLRLVFLLDGAIAPEQYEPVARKIADELGMDCFDDTTFQPARLMFWPAVCRDGEIFKHHNPGAPLNAQAILKSYADWRDFAEWPHSSRVKTVRPSGKQAEDPLTKQGIIGAFNRTFGIHAAISRFDLPYESTDFENRYRPSGATGASGAVVYDDLFLYSHHESDAVGQQNVNAWDLVRVHKYGKQDSGDLDGVPVMQWPSSKLMAALAGAIPEVQRELRAPAHEMDILADEPGAQQDKKQELEQALTFDSLRDEISEISPTAINLVKVCKSMIARIAAAKLDADDVDILAGSLRFVYPKPQPAKASLLLSIKRAGQRLTGDLASDGALHDMERELISAALLEHYHRGDTLKRIGRKCWTYEDGLWAIAGDEPVRGNLARTFTRLREERPEDMMSLVATVGESKTSALVKSVWGLMCDDLSTRENRDDPLLLQRSFPLPIINCKNCEIWLDAKGNVDVRDHDPANFFTTRIDTNYDPQARCPEWDRFMRLVFSQSSDVDDMTRHFEELGGYIIQFSRWLKTWVMFHGETDTGKSTAAMILQELLGNAYTGKPMAKINNSGDTFAEQGLIGKLLMVDDDFAYDGHLPDGFLKTYSEEKPVTASIKYGDDVNFKARALPLILSNHWPVTRDTTGAFIERALVIPFEHRIIGANKSDQRRNLMMGELPGILNRFVEGLVRLRRRGSWDRPIDCIEVEKKWATKSNPALQFVSECLVIGGGPANKIKRARLYDLYVHWNSEQSGHSSRQYIMKKGQFMERMRAVLGEEVKSGDWCFQNVSAKTALIDGIDDISDDWSQ